MTHCLVVDDSHVVRRVLCRILEEFGLICAEADNGETALEYCQNSLPEVIFLDWNMPVMNGLEFIEKLNQMENMSIKPSVIFCTTENDMTLISKGMKAGAAEYIMKPFDNKIIRKKLIQAGIISKNLQTAFDS